MAYNQTIADEVRKSIALRTDRVAEKTMFGGLCFMVEDKICICVKKDTLLVRVAPEIYDQEVELPGRKAMGQAGRTVKPYLFIDLEQMATPQELALWVNRCLDYNPLAPLSKAKQKVQKTLS